MHISLLKIIGTKKRMCLYTCNNKLKLNSKILTNIFPTMKNLFWHAQIVMLLVVMKYNYDRALCYWIKGVSCDDS